MAFLISAVNSIVKPFQRKKLQPVEDQKPEPLEVQARVIANLRLRFTQVFTPSIEETRSLIPGEKNTPYKPDTQAFFKDCDRMMETLSYNGKQTIQQQYQKDLADLQNAEDPYFEEKKAALREKITQQFIQFLDSKGIKKEQQDEILYRFSQKALTSPDMQFAAYISKFYGVFLFESAQNEAVQSCVLNIPKRKEEPVTIDTQRIVVYDRFVGTDEKVQNLKNLIQVNTVATHVLGKKTQTKAQFSIDPLPLLDDLHKEFKQVDATIKRRPLEKDQFEDFDRMSQLFSYDGTTMHDKYKNRKDLSKEDLKTLATTDFHKFLIGKLGKERAAKLLPQIYKHISCKTLDSLKDQLNACTQQKLGGIQLKNPEQSRDLLESCHLHIPEDGISPVEVTIERVAIHDSFVFKGMTHRLKTPIQSKLVARFKIGEETTGAVLFSFNTIE